MRPLWWVRLNRLLVAAANPGAETLYTAASRECYYNFAGTTTAITAAFEDVSISQDTSDISSLTGRSSSDSTATSSLTTALKKLILES